MENTLILHYQNQFGEAVWGNNLFWKSYETYMHCGKNSEFVSINVNGTYSNHYFKGLK
jgi:hypothetical protein